jgi:hypothetical protein
MWLAIDAERKILETLPALGGQGIATSQASPPARTFNSSRAQSAAELRCGDGGIARGVSGGHGAGGPGGFDELAEFGACLKQGFVGIAELGRIGGLD